MPKIRTYEVSWIESCRLTARLPAQDEEDAIHKVREWSMHPKKLRVNLLDTKSEGIVEGTFEVARVFEEPTGRHTQ